MINVDGEKWNHILGVDGNKRVGEDFSLRSFRVRKAGGQAGSRQPNSANNIYFKIQGALYFIGVV